MINVIGLGYIGLPTTLMFASRGVAVVGTDINEQLVQELSNGQLSFNEKGLEELYNKAISNGVKFSTHYQKADTYIISVPTPYIKSTKKLDPCYVINAINNILDVCEKGSVLIIESTVAPGTIDRHIRPVIKDRGFILGEDVHLVHAPERIIPGNMVYELVNNSRAIGADDPRIGHKVKSIYNTFCKSEIVVTDIKSAEMSKVVENTYRDINIAYANELAKICRAGDMDVYEIIKIANMHPRVDILSPGPGVGGHCISVDPWFLVGEFPDLTNLILQARKTNDSMPEYVFKRIRTIMNEQSISEFSKIGLYGLTYKENVDDVRESPTLQLLDYVQQLNVEMKVFDPLIKENVTANQYFSFSDFLSEIEMVVILVAHNHVLENLDLIGNRVILDTKNICNCPKTYKL